MKIGWGGHPDTFRQRSSNKSSPDENIGFCYACDASRPAAVENVLCHRCAVYIWMPWWSACNAGTEPFNHYCSFQAFCFHRSNVLLTGRYASPLPPIGELIHSSVPLILIYLCKLFWKWSRFYLVSLRLCVDEEEDEESVQEISQDQPCVLRHMICTMPSDTWWDHLRCVYVFHCVYLFNYLFIYLIIYLIICLFI